MRTLLNTLPTNVLEESNSVAGKMKMFYDSCMSREYIEADSNKPLLRIIKTLGLSYYLNFDNYKNFTVKLSY